MEPLLKDKPLASSSLSVSDQVLYRPPRFQLGDDPLDWIEEFSQAVLINEWDNKRAVALAIAHLHPTAKKIFQPLKFPKYEDFEAAFRKKYHQNHYKERAYAQAQAYRQGPDEDVEFLVAKMTKLFERAGITEDSVKRALFKKAANKFIYARIIRKCPATFEEMVEVASEADQLRRAEMQHDEASVDVPERATTPEPRPAAAPQPSTSRAWTSPTQAENKPITEQNMSVDELATLMGRMSVADVNAAWAKARPAFAGRVGQQQPPRPANPSRPTVVCYRCNEPGHYASSCSAPASKQINWVEASEPELVTEEEVNAVTRTQSRNAAKVNAHPYQRQDAAPEPAAKIRAPRDSVIILQPQNQARESMDVPQAPVPPMVNQPNVSEQLQESDEEMSPVPAKRPVRRKANTRVSPSTLSTLAGFRPYSIFNDLMTTPASITLAQALQFKEVQKELTKGLKPITHEVSQVELPQAVMTSAHVKVNLYGHELKAVADSGASLTIITSGLADFLGLTPDDRSQHILTGFNGKKEMSRGVISHLPVRIKGALLPGSAVIVERAEKALLLGMQWLKTHGAFLDLEQDHLYFKTGPNRYRVPIETLRSRTPLMPLPAEDDGEDTDEEDEEDDANDSEDFEVNAVAVETTPVVPDNQDNRYPMTEEEEAALQELLRSFDDVFADDISELQGQMQTRVKHSIDTGDHPPVHIKPYRIPRAHLDATLAEIAKMKAAGIVVDSQSPWCAPVLPIEKKDGGLRICVDYRALNKITKKDSYPLPRIDDLLDALDGACVFSALDALAGYWQIPMREQDQEKTAFGVLGHGLYEFRVMPFGLTNAPSTFQRAMENICRDLSFVRVYIDDILVFSKSVKAHLEHLEQVFSKLAEHGIKLKRKKCHFVQEKIVYLGFVVSGSKIEPMPSKVEALRNAPPPRNVSEVRSFIQSAGYYRRFVFRFTKVSRPLNYLLRKAVGWEWTQRQKEAYDSLIRSLTSKPVLALINWSLAFIMTTDASGEGLALILSQLFPDGEHPVYYASRSLSKAEQNYSPVQLEGLCVIWGIKYFRHYLLGRRFTLRTDHAALISLFSSKTPLTGKLARWSMILSEYDFEIQHLKGSINPADFMSRNLVHEDVPDNDEHDLFAVSHVLGGMDFALYLAIKYYLESQTYPTGAIEADRKKLRKRAAGYFVRDGDLFLRRRKAPLGYLQVLHERNAMRLIRDVHDEFHDGVDNTLRRVLQRYTGPYLRQVVEAVVRTCHLCQTHNPSNLAGRAEPMHPIEALRPLAVVGVDVVGPITPPSPDGYRYILTAIDYLTRWPLAVPSKDATTESMVDFLLNHLISTFGVPEKIITDRGSIFNDRAMELLFSRLNIKHSMTTAYRPQANGRVERMHRTLKTILAKLTENDRESWPKTLWKALLAIRTMANESTRQTPAKLLYGFELATPAVWQPAPDRDLDEPIETTIESRVREMDVDVARLRQEAIDNSAQAHTRYAQRYDRSVVPRSFKVDDLVLLRIEQPTALSQTAKFSQIFEGPYTVFRVLPNGTYVISDGQGARDIVHIDRLKPYSAHREMIPEIVSAAKPLRSVLRRFRSA